MRILVTGGAGYIGSHAALRLLDDGHDVTVLDNLYRGHLGAIDALRAAGGARMRFVEGDLGDTALIARVLRDGAIACVMHFAALTYVGESVERPAEYFRVNTDGGASLLAAMRETGVRRIVFSSTAATYGEPAPHEVPIVESLAQRPVNPYGASKLRVEVLLRAEAAGTARGDALGAVALRYFNVAGADPHGRVGEDHRPETHIVPICLEVALGKRPHLTVFGDDYATPDGTCVRDYVHVADLVSAHLASLSVLAPGSFRCWNVGIGRGYSVREVVESVRRVTGHPIPLVMGARRAGDPASLFANADAIRRDLGWQPRYTDLDEIIATAWRWHRAHPDGYR